MSRREVLKDFLKYQEETDLRVNYGIEQYRKGNFRISVVDKEGKPVKNAKVVLSLKKHEFKFGANIFMLDELETKEKNEQYKKYFADTFNMATLPFYWKGLENEKGKPRYDKDSPKVYRRPAPDLCMEFCEKHGIEPREHALAYDWIFPDWVKELPVDEAKKEFTRRCKEISERYADKIRTIEVTNECFWDCDQSSAMYNENDFVEWCFKEAERYFPYNQLVINDWTGVVWGGQPRNRHAFFMQIERALAKNARIDAIGMQYHMFYKAENEIEKTRAYYNPRYLFSIMDKYGEFNRPLQVTEVTIPSYTYEAEDEEIQAEIIRQLYRIWFSHKNMEQIIYWNLVDGYAAFAPQGDFTSGENYYRGGLLRFDMTPKPAYFAIKDLIEKEWNTQTEVVTDENGYAYFKGFYGDYSATIGKDEFAIKAYKKLPLDNELNKKIAKITVNEEK